MFVRKGNEPMLREMVCVRVFVGNGVFCGVVCAWNWNLSR